MGFSQIKKEIGFYLEKTNFYKTQNEVTHDEKILFDFVNTLYSYEKNKNNDLFFLLKITNDLFNNLYKKDNLCFKSLIDKIYNNTLNHKRLNIENPLFNYNDILIKCIINKCNLKDKQYFSVEDFLKENNTKEVKNVFDELNIFEQSSVVMENIMFSILEKIANYNRSNFVDATSIVEKFIKETKVDENIKNDLNLLFKKNIDFIGLIASPDCNIPSFLINQVFSTIGTSYKVKDIIDLKIEKEIEKLSSLKNNESFNYNFIDELLYILKNHYKLNSDDINKLNDNIKPYFLLNNYLHHNENEIFNYLKENKNKDIYFYLLMNKLKNYQFLSKNEILNEYRDNEIINEVLKISRKRAFNDNNFYETSQTIKFNEKVNTTNLYIVLENFYKENLFLSKKLSSIINYLPNNFLKNVSLGEDFKGFEKKELIFNNKDFFDFASKILQQIDFNQLIKVNSNYKEQKEYLLTIMEKYIINEKISFTNNINNDEINNKKTFKL